MKNILYKSLAGAAVLVATACTGDYLDINSNQSQPGDLTADGYALVSSMQNIAGAIVPADVNCNQFTDCLLGGTLGGYFSDGAPGFVTSFARNNAPDNWSSVFLTDRKIISTLYTNLSMVEGFCETSGDVVPMPVANIMKVAAMSRVTDCYGPIPYTGIGFEGVVKTPYDSQESIYKSFFTELQEARQILLDNSTAVLSPLADLVYGGDLSKWVRFANSLQLRFALRIAYADPQLAKQMAEDAINPANGGVIETNDQNATWKNYSTSTNPMRTAIMYNAQDSRPSAEIACYLNGFNDPRAPKYLTESAWKDENGAWMVDGAGVSAQYAGIRRGWTSLNTDWSVKFSSINLLGNAPALWLNAAEVCFLRAEGAAVFGWDMGGNAESFYNQGVKLSMEDNGITDAAVIDAYLADETSTATTYYDPSDVNPYNGVFSTITIKWDDAASTEEKQERIITQKWLANWTLGNEAWADYRRTGYPKLIPVAYNGSTVVNINRGPQRMAYPNSEYLNNGENVQKAVSEYLGGPDNLATRVWWACKPGL